MRPHFDIYADAAPAELLRVRPVLQELSVRVADLQQQFPEHAGLATISKLTARLRSGVSLGREALMKFVTGCELLLRAIDDWERNAAHFVSLMEPRDGLVRVITDWRKLELRCPLEFLLDKKKSVIMMLLINLFISSVIFWRS